VIARDEGDRETSYFHQSHDVGRQRLGKDRPKQQEEGEKKKEDCVWILIYIIHGRYKNVNASAISSRGPKVNMTMAARVEQHERRVTFNGTYASTYRRRRLLHL
jgi:hypothetical protein